MLVWSKVSVAIFSFLPDYFDIGLKAGTAVARTVKQDGRFVPYPIPLSINGRCFVCFGAKDTSPMLRFSCCTGA